MRWILRVGIGFTVAVLVTSCQPPENNVAMTEETVVARVGGEPIFRSDVELEMARGGEVDRAAARQRLIRAKQYALAARSLGFHDDAEARRSWDQWLGNRLRAEIERELAAEEPTDEAIAHVYVNRRSEFTTPAAVLGAVLILSGPDARQRLEEALTKLDQDNSNRSFGNLSIDYSEDQATRYRGGQLRWISEQQRDTHRLGPEVVTALLALREPGELSPVLPSGDRWFVTRLLERRNPVTAPLDQVRNQILVELKQEQRTKRQMDYEESLAARFPVELLD